MRRLLGVVSACGLAVGCAHPGAGPTPDNEAVLRGEGSAVSVRVAAGGYTGPTIQVQRLGDELRGTSDGRAVELALSSDEIQGLVGGSPVELHLTRTDDGLHLLGMYRGQQSDLQLTAEKVQGRLGACSYDLTARGATYAGQASCGGAPFQAELRLPQALLDKPLSERAAAVSLLLGSSPGQLSLSGPNAPHRPIHIRALAMSHASSGGR